jgi:hypothetical protein
VTDRAYDTDLLDTLSERVVVGNGAIGTQLQAPTRSRRNALGCNLVNLGDCDIPDKIRELSLRAVRSPCGSGSIAAMSWASRRRSGDDVDFPGREALQRFRVPAGIRHARQS